MLLTPQAQAIQNIGTFITEDKKGKLLPPTSKVCANPNCKEDPTTAATMRCTRCKKAMYHNRDCQVDHWADHKSMCNNYLFAKKLEKDTKKAAKLKRAAKK